MPVRTLVQLPWPNRAAIFIGPEFGTVQRSDLVDAWQLTTWDAYRDVARLGRRTRLPEAQREALWSIFTRVRSELASSDKVTRSELYTALAAQIATSAQVVFDFIVVDEAQDVSVAQLRSSLPSATRDRTRCSSPATSDSGSSSSRSRGDPLAWTSAGAPARCG